MARPLRTIGYRCGRETDYANPKIYLKFSEAYLTVAL